LTAADAHGRFLLVLPRRSAFGSAGAGRARSARVLAEIVLAVAPAALEPESLSTNTRAIASEYEDHAIAEAGEDELIAALEDFGVTGHVLELACGPGAWTERLLERATSVTAVDAAPEMLARAKARVGHDRVRFIQADLFAWTPDRRYDVVCFGFWLSHVPLDRFESFWELVDSCLEPTGRVFFVDDAYRTPDELIEGGASSTIRRRLNDGTAYRAVKVPHRPADLEEAARAARMAHPHHADIGPILLGCWSSGGNARDPGKKVIGAFTSTVIRAGTSTRRRRLRSRCPRSGGPDTRR
jgi:SAM-dependent methyltransferase